MIPILFLLLLMLIQPGILLYDRTVMNEAASEGCRVLATSSNSTKQAACEPFIRRRLGSIPQTSIFHVHDGDCSYQIDLNGSQDDLEVSVEITNEVQPLPVVGFFSETLGLLNENKNFNLTVTARQKTNPDWTRNSPEGTIAEKWVGGWLD